MTDQPGREPEQRLPERRSEAEPPSADRFTAPPQAHSFELTPERASRIVRASGDSRLIGFLAVLFVGLFVIGYYFYELAPFGLTESRLESEAAAQQVTAVERGYNIYQANCARCHGVNGEGGIGPVLNRQDKLFQHLDEAYLHTILLVGGRYACGDPNSLMPLWSNEGSPPGPLNYEQINELIEFIRASKDETFIIRDPELFEPLIDPATGQPRTFTGWVDPAYAPEPGATPFPACWKDEFAAPPQASPGASPEPGASAAPSEAPGEGAVLEISAPNLAFDKDALEAPAATAFQIRFANNDAGVPHNVEIRDEAGTSIWVGDIFNGVETRVYDVPALPAGTYTFICTVHPNMVGTLTVR
jgi:mono/diheme cytochrome c family protein/plastocyanin